MATITSKSGLRALPSVDKVLAEPALASVLAAFGRDFVVDAVRVRLAAARTAVAAGAPAPSAGEVAAGVADAQSRATRPWPAPVINATGVILHTNLGRALLSDEAIAAVQAAARDYGDLEMDLETGQRGSRHSAVAGLLRQLTGAEAAIAVNNNAGAVLLGLAAVAEGKEVIVSRGESAEIGGGFRIPEVLVQSGAKLVEVGTVNRTYARDYERAITPETAALLIVHRSNFQVVGFTHEAALREVVDVGRKHGLPVLHDLGSGALLESTAFGLAHEPMPQESVAVGAGLVFFSGDKLLGGPQAGLVVGRAELVERLASHPLARALRADKLTLAALHATLVHYLKEEATVKVPIWAMIGASGATLRRRAVTLARRLGPAAGVQPGWSAIGGGSLPAQRLATWVVRIDAAQHGGADAAMRRLRSGIPPVVARVEDDGVLLDLRTVPVRRDRDLARAVVGALGVGSPLPASQT